MTKDKRFYLFWLAFLLSLAFTTFVNASVVNPPFSQQNPTASIPQQAVGTTDSLQIATQLFHENKHKEALKISLALLQKATQSKDSFQIKKSSFLIAEIFKNTNNYEKALSYIKKSMRFTTKSTDLNSFVDLQLKMAVMFSKTNRLDSAIVFFNKVLKRKTNDTEIKRIQAKAFSNLSAVYLLKNDIIQAESNALEALYLQKKFKNNLDSNYSPKFW